jgi:transposase
MKELHLLVINPNQVLLIDETHTGTISSHRSRAWGKVWHDVVLDKWFHDGKQYTMMGVADVNGFVQYACVCFRRDALCDDPQCGASGNVNTQVFIDWLTLKILPLLGNFEKGEPRSIVNLDNSSIHMDDETASLIHIKGAYILYTAAFSPDINPIEKMFVIYKACVKQNQALLASNSWYHLHLFSLGNVTPDISLSDLKKCGFPFKDLNTVKEKEEIMVAVATILTFVTVATIIEKTTYINRMI